MQAASRRGWRSMGNPVSSAWAEPTFKIINLKTDFIIVTSLGMEGHMRERQAVRLKQIRVTAKHIGEYGLMQGMGYGLFVTVVVSGGLMIGESLSRTLSGECMRGQWVD